MNKTGNFPHDDYDSYSHEPTVSMEINASTLGRPNPIPTTFAARVSKWAHDRNLIEGSTPAKQLNKLAEELVELVTAIATDDQKEIEDAIGDMNVVLAIIAEQRGTTLSVCQERAWNSIKNRKGKMVNGIFVKEE